MLLKPLYRFRIQMVRRLIKQENIRLLDHQPAERDPTFFTTRQRSDLLISRWTTQGIHRKVELVLQFPAVGSFDLLLQLSLLVEQLFHLIRPDFAHLIADSFVLMHQRNQLSLALFDDFFDRLVGIELGFLFQQADAIALGSRDLAGVIWIHTGNDLQQRTLARTVQAQHSDLRPVVETEVDLPQHLPLGRIDLPDIDE